MNAAKKLAVLALLTPLSFLASPLCATPTRALTLDNQQQLVTDDYDSIVYYHLIPRLLDSSKAHFYVDALSNGRVQGWVFADTGFGAVALWWNRDYAPNSLFKTLGSSANMGYSLTDFNDLSPTAHAPREGRVGLPDMKLAAGYGVEPMDGVALGICLQYAQLAQEQEFATSDGLGSPGMISASQATYMNSAYYPGLGVSSYKHRQSSSGLALVPLFGLSGQSYALDTKFEFILNSINNTHSEEVRDVAGPTATQTGSITQSLQDKGAMSYGAKARYRLVMGSGSFVIRASDFMFDLSTKHRVKGSFSGALSPNQLAGYDHTDQEQGLKVHQWEGMLGWVQSFGKGRALLVFGAGANGSSTHIEDLKYAPKSAGGSLDDLGKASRQDTLTDTFAVPVLIGGELELAPWAMARGVVQRNFWGSTKTAVQGQGFNPATGLISSQSDSSSYSDAVAEWTFGTGIGFDIGAFKWDLALNSAFFASSAGWVNPAYQSTLSWGF